MVSNFLNGKYNLWIGRHGPIHWPANSPDLTPLDNFLWGYLKDRVYCNRTHNLISLRQKIELEILNLNNEYPFYISNAIRKLNELYQECFNNGGSYVNI